MTPADAARLANACERAAFTMTHAHDETGNPLAWCDRCCVERAARHFRTLSWAAPTLASSPADSAEDAPADVRVRSGSDGTCGGDGEIPYATHAGGFAPDYIPCPACSGTVKETK